MFLQRMTLIASTLLGLFFALPPAPVVPLPAIDKPARELVVNFNAGRFDLASKDFNQPMRAVTTPAILATVKQQLDRDAGAFKEITDLRHAKEDTYRVVELMCAYEKGEVQFRVLFDPFDRIGSLSAKRIVPDAVDNTIETAARGLLSDFTAGRFEDATKRFNDNLRRQLPLARLIELKSEVTQRYGVFRSVTRVAQRQQQTYRVVDLISSYEKGPVSFTVVFDGSGKVAGVHIEPAAP